MTMPSAAPMRMARQAGALYLLIAVFGGFAIGYVPSQIVAPGNAEITLAQLQANGALFSAGILADMVVISAEIALTALLYFLLRPVSQARALIAAMARFSMVLVMAANLFLHVVAYQIALGNMAGTPETVLAIFEAHAMGIYLWQVFFAMHLLVLGGLVCRAGYWPSLFGAALFIGAFGYLIEGVSQLIGFENALLGWVGIGLLVLVTVAELGFALWLLIKGMDVEKWQARAI